MSIECGSCEIEQNNLSHNDTSDNSENATLDFTVVYNKGIHALFKQEGIAVAVENHVLFILVIIRYFFYGAVVIGGVILRERVFPAIQFFHNLFLYFAGGESAVIVHKELRAFVKKKPDLFSLKPEGHKTVAEIGIRYIIP